MKTSRVLAFVGAALVVGILAARWCAAQPAYQTSIKEPTTDNYISIRQLESFVASLQDNKQTNSLMRFNDFLNASITSHNSADLGMTLAILQRLRDGRTNEAFALLEDKVSTDIIGFVASYRELPVSLREKTS